jgi:hypothetical protein
MINNIKMRRQNSIHPRGMHVSWPSKVQAKTGFGIEQLFSTRTIRYMAKLKEFIQFGKA